MTEIRCAELAAAGLDRDHPDPDARRSRADAAMAARASAAGAPDADVVLARHVLTAVGERRVVAP
jgi:hypothetical protein